MSYRNRRSTEGFYDDYISPGVNWVEKQGSKAYHWVEDEFEEIEHGAVRIVSSGIDIIEDEIHAIPGQIKAVGSFLDDSIDYAIDKLAQAEEKLLPSTQTIISSELLLLAMVGLRLYIYTSH